MSTASYGSILSQFDVKNLGCFSTAECVMSTLLGVEGWDALSCDILEIFITAITPSIDCVNLGVLQSIFVGFSVLSKGAKVVVLVRKNTRFFSNPLICNNCNAALENAA